MAYDPQQQRPEEQALNNNRESLNIRQPGETGSTGFDWEQVRKAREAAGRKSVVPDPRANEVGRASQTYDGETVPGNAIADKNIIFASGPVPNTDEAQAGSAPAFSRGETRNQRNLREYTDGIRMPKPFEFGTFFATMPERLVRALDGKDSAGKFGKLVAHNFMEMMAFNPIPQVAMPIAEAYVNYDFFKGGLIENMADSNLIAGARYNDQTSLLMREIGETTNLSPKMLDHIIQGYTGSLGAYVMGATNILMRGMQDNGETASMRLDEMPVIKSLVRGYGDDPAKSTQFSEDFYRIMQQVNQIQSTINSYRKQGRTEDAQELQEENRDKLSQRKGLTATQKELRQLNNRIELVRIDRILTAEQKRERIDRFMAQRNKLVQQAVERVNPYFIK